MHFVEVGRRFFPRIQSMEGENGRREGTKERREEGMEERGRTGGEETKGRRQKREAERDDGRAGGLFKRLKNSQKKNQQCAEYRNKKLNFFKNGKNKSKTMREFPLLFEGRRTTAKVVHHLFQFLAICLRASKKLFVIFEKRKICAQGAI